MAVLRVLSGECDVEAPAEELELCLTGADKPDATHPPLDVRAELVRRILDDGEDLRDRLKPIDALQLD